MINQHDARDMEIVRARLRLDNATLFARTVAQESGLLSPEYAVAAMVVQAEQRRLVLAYLPEPVSTEGVGK